MPRDQDMEIEKILTGFDPRDDERDRRILYEVLGMRLYRDEFMDGSSSDEDDIDNGLLEIEKSLNYDFSSFD